MYEGNQNSPPVSVGEELDVEITALGEKGDGLTKKDGFVIFVPNTQIGDNVKIRVTKLLNKVAFGEVVDEGSPVEPAEGEEQAEIVEDEAEQEAPAEETKEKPKQQAEASDETPEDTYDFGEEEK